MDLEATLYTTRGAVKAVAKRLAISEAAVSQWRQRGIPKHRQEAVGAALADHLRTIGAQSAPSEPRAA